MLLGMKKSPITVGKSFERLLLCRNLMQSSFPKLSEADVKAAVAHLSF